MSLDHILSLIGQPLPMGRVNVRGTDYEPMLRVLTRIEWRQVGEARWLYWLWTPEQNGPRMDCGYSGRREDALFPESKENENCAAPEHSNHAGYYQPALSFGS